MAERIVPLGLAWLLLCALIGGSVHVAVPMVLRRWRAQVAQVEARVRVLLDMPLPPQPQVWDLLRPGSGEHRKRRLPRWLRWVVAR